MPSFSLLRPRETSLWKAVKNLIDAIIVPDSGKDALPVEPAGVSAAPAKAAMSAMSAKPTRKYRRNKKVADDSRSTKSRDSLDNASTMFPKISYNGDISLGTAKPCALDMNSMNGSGFNFTFNSNDVIETNFDMMQLQLPDFPQQPQQDFAIHNDLNINLPVQPEVQVKQEPKPVDSITSIKKDTKAKSETLDDDEKEFVCHYCDAKFRIRGYLTRHIKKHAIEKAYHCPFYNGQEVPSKRCHNSGGFSRRDTYKTHMKARHLIYPEGVNFASRNESSGHCAKCGGFIAKAATYVEDHIESGQCPALPAGYHSESLRRTSKSASKSATPASISSQSVSPTTIPASLPTNYQKKRRNKMKKITTSNGTTRYVSTLQSWVEPKVLENKDALEAMAIVASETGRNDVFTTLDDNKILMDSQYYVAKSGSRQNSTRKNSDKTIKQNSRQRNSTGKPDNGNGLVTPEYGYEQIKQGSRSNSNSKGVNLHIAPPNMGVKLEHADNMLASPATSISTGVMNSISPISNSAMDSSSTHSSYASSLNDNCGINTTQKMQHTQTSNILPNNDMANAGPDFSNLVDLDKIGFDAMLALCPVNNDQENYKEDKNFMLSNMQASGNRINFPADIETNLNKSAADIQLGNTSMRPQNFDTQHFPREHMVVADVDPTNAGLMSDLHVKENQKYMQYYQQFFSMN